jgi:endonuclease I
MNRRHAKPLNPIPHRFFSWLRLGIALLCAHTVAAGQEFSGLHGPALRGALHAQVRGHTVIPYASSRFDTADALRQLDGAIDGTNAVVRLIYGDGTAPAEAFGVTGGWNREHVWPNSYGLDDVEPAFSDLHNLRACDANVNSSRGNKFYDLSDALSAGYRFPAHAEAPRCSADSDSWEPPADQRGDLARALFYMDVRYEGDTSNEPDLVLVDDVSKIGTTTNLMGRLGVLLQWNEEDPPDDAERAHDAGVKALQGNSNPFIAEPQLANALYIPSPILMLAGDSVIIGRAAGSSDVNTIFQFSASPTGPWSETPPQHFGDNLFMRLRVVLSPISIRPR